jgi:hypothetical protein
MRFDDRHTGEQACGSTGYRVHFFQLYLRGTARLAGIFTEESYAKR